MGTAPHGAPAAGAAGIHLRLCFRLAAERPADPLFYPDARLLAPTYGTRDLEDRVAVTVRAAALLTGDDLVSEWNLAEDVTVDGHPVRL